jgi:hypothetical protein
VLASIRRQYAQLVTSGAQLLLLLVGLQIGTFQGWIITLSIMALISLFAWISALRRWREISGTPTSRIASAAQGHVELIGRGKAFADIPLLSPLRNLPCLWYRYKIERRDSDNKWHEDGSGESVDSFVLDDGSGQCVVDPCDAEIITIHKDSWQKDEYRYTEWKLLNIDSIYAIGEFRTLGGSSLALDANEELKKVLAEWKQDTKSLHARFDLNKDGELDTQEWELARQAARREAESRMREAYNQTDTHYLGKPQNQRLFLISNLPPEKLSRRYALWTWVHLMIFFGALGGMAWLPANQTM